MERRNISLETYNRIKDRLPIEIINMLPEKPFELLKYATRIVKINIAPNIEENTAKLMEEYLLSDEEYLLTFFYVMAISFYNKKPVDNPKLTIVAAQTGSGKSNLTAKILRENENYVFVDSDKYKHYRYDAVDISNKYPLLYPFLTGPDGYDHAENIYEYALEHKYNIIKETAPSYNKGLLGVDINKLKKNKYEISLNILAVSGLNSALSMHERYEVQILSGLKTVKLTDLSRHDDSYKGVEIVCRMLTPDNISIYRRGLEEEQYIPQEITKHNSDSKLSQMEILQILYKERENSNKSYVFDTKNNFQEDFNKIINSMKLRNAPEAQSNQLYEIYNRYINYLNYIKYKESHGFDNADI